MCAFLFLGFVFCLSCLVNNGLLCVVGAGGCFCGWRWGVVCGCGCVFFVCGVRVCVVGGSGWLVPVCGVWRVVCVPVGYWVVVSCCLCLCAVSGVGGVWLFRGVGCGCVACVVGVVASGGVGVGFVVGCGCVAWWCGCFGWCGCWVWLLRGGGLPVWLGGVVASGGVGVGFVVGLPVWLGGVGVPVSGSAPVGFCPLMCLGLVLCPRPSSVVSECGGVVVCVIGARAVFGVSWCSLVVGWGLLVWVG